MNEPVIVRNTFAVALVALVQAVAPSVVAVSLLYLIILAYGNNHVPPYFHYMAAIVALVMLLLPYPSRASHSQIVGGSFPLTASVLLRWGILLAVLLAIAYVAKFSGQYSRRVVLTWAVVTPAVLIMVAALFQEIMRRLLSTPANARRTVFVGLNDISLAVAGDLQKNSEYGLAVAGFFDDRRVERLHVRAGARLLGRLRDIPGWVKRFGAQVIFIALPVRHLRRVTDLLDELRDTTVSIYYVPDILVFDLIQARTGAINGIPVIAMCETPFYGSRGLAKRVADVVLATVLLLATAPLTLAIALAIKLDSPGAVIFRQRRYGLDGEEISVFKFRSMHVTEDGRRITQATRDDPRLTRVGRFLRRYSLDELPQLFNVLQGTMSVVGPRPHAVAHNEMYRKLIKGYMIRHKVRPGITGLAQVNGLRGETRNIEQMEARVRYDLEYLRNWSIGLDLRILVRTALRVLNDNEAF